MTDIRLNDILVMKKQHPCGSRSWLVLRTGADLKLRCQGCGHEVWLPRGKAEKNLKTIRRGEESFDGGSAVPAKNTDGK